MSLLDRIPPARRLLPPRPPQAPMGEKHPQRNDEIVRLRGTGMTLQAIGDKHGLTRQRVAMILDRRGKVGTPVAS